MGCRMQASGKALLGALIALFLVVPKGDTAELRPIAGIAAFGGAERGHEDEAHGIGGTQLLGLVPLTQQFGLQGSTSFTGGRGFRFGLSAGPVLHLASSRAGLFVDYEHRAHGDANLAAVRGSWAYYLDQFDLELTYSHPVSSAKNSGGIGQVGMNQLQGLLRFYPTKRSELNAGLIVNSFAGVDHSKGGGSGVGGTFGLSFKLFDPVVVHLFQGQFDNRERYRVVSGIQIIFGSTLQDWQRSHIPVPIGGGAGRIKTSKRAQAPPVGGGI